MHHGWWCLTQNEEKASKICIKGKVGQPGEEKSGPWHQGMSPGVTPAPSPFSHDGGVKTKEHKH